MIMLLPADGDRDSSAPRAGAGVPPCPTAIRQLAPTLGQKSRPQVPLAAGAEDKPQVVHLPDLENADRVSDTPSLSSRSSSKGRASEHSLRSSNYGSFDVLRIVEHATPLFSGILFALHGAIGARLGATYDSPFFACMINMTVALGLLLLFAYITPFFCKSVADGSAVAAVSEAVAMVSRVVTSRTTSKNDTVADNLSEDELCVQEAGVDGSEILAGGHHVHAVAVEEDVEHMKAAKQDEQILDANQLSCSTTASVPPSLFNIAADAPASTSSGVLASPDSCKGQTKTKAAQGSPAPTATPSPLKSLLRTRLNRLFAPTTTSSASSLSAPGTQENGSSGNLSSGSNMSGEDGLFEDSVVPAFPKMASLEEIDLRCEGDARATERDLNILPNADAASSAAAAADPNLSPKNCAPSQAGRSQAQRHYEPVRPWKLSGGFFGTFIVTSSFLAIARLGTVTFFLLSAAGQLTASMLCDNFGFAGLSKRPVTIGKAAAVFLVACGATLVITSSTLEGGSSGSSSSSSAVENREEVGASNSSTNSDLSFFQRLGFMFLAFCAGFSLPVQASINSAARRCFSTVFSGALVSFTGASFASTLLFFSIDYPLPPAKSDVQWWMFGTGFIGAFTVFSGMMIGPRIGQTMMWLLILLGYSHDGGTQRRPRNLEKNLQKTSKRVVISELFLGFGIQYCALV
mmetsp:Transcript_12514/g.30431  ORF Transcript_12514/g.30431 Transcript_12514/m.30431 type:complete len:689 (-) Transcript_12514:1802-3868(-)